MAVEADVEAAVPEDRLAVWPFAALVLAAAVTLFWYAADDSPPSLLTRTVIVIGPKHTPHGMDWAVAPHQTWEFPGGSLESDFLLARRLQRQGHAVRSAVGVAQGADSGVRRWFGCVTGLAARG